MRIHSLLILLVTSMLSATIHAQQMQNKEYGKPQSVGLVLSGGGAKGIAHIGVIRALEEHNIPIDYVAGTSMGAIIGGFYACGYTPEQMLELILSPGFKSWSSGKMNPKLTYYFAENEQTPAMGKVSLGPKDSTEVKSILPSSVISPLPMNFAFMDLFAGYTAQCKSDFNNLFVPYRCVTSDVYAKHKIVMRNGSLGDAIRASMSFPSVFQPIEINGVLCFDGGIYDNFPVDVMREDFAPDIIIGSNVAAPDKKPNPNDLFQQLEDMIIQNNDYNLPASEGIKMDVPVTMFGLLDWNAAREIEQIGYNTAMQFMDSIEHRVTSRIPADARTLQREVFKAQTPYLRFDTAKVTGGTPKQNDYIEYLFTHNKKDTFGLESARLSYYRALTPGRLKNLVPQAVYNEKNGLFDLNLKATVKENFNLGLGGYLSSGTASMLFLSAGYNTLSFNSAEMNVNGWIGQSYLAGTFNAKMNLKTDIPSRLHLQGVITRHKFYENDRLFFEDNQPVFITHQEAFARLNYEWAAGQRGKWTAGIGVGHIHDRFYHNTKGSFTEDNRDNARQNLGQLVVRYDYNTLDNQSAPTEGARYTGCIMGVMGRYKFVTHDTVFSPELKHPRWVQAEFTSKNYFGIGNHFALGFETDILWSSMSLLGNYYSSIIEAPAYHPTASSYNSFNAAFHANEYLAAGIVPVWKISSMVQMRGSFHGFLPFRKIEETPNYGVRYGKWFSNPEFMGELSMVVTLPFATVSAYANYASYPAKNWNYGLTFGLFFLAPRFLR